MKIKRLQAFLLVPFLLTILGASLVQAEFRFLRQNSEPKYFPHDSQRLGLCDQVYARMKQHLEQAGLSVVIDPELYPIKRILAMMSSGKGHVFCGAGRNAERERKYGYSTKPVYDVSNVVIAHRDEDFVPKSLEQLAGEEIVVGAYFGTSSAAFLKKQAGVRVLDNIKTLDQGMQFVANGRISYFYYHDLGLAYLVNESDLPIKLLPTRFRTVPQWLLYSPHLDAPDKKRIDDTLTTLYESAELEQINSAFLVMNP